MSNEYADIGRRETSCDCTFAYWSVTPPTHCPKCGRCLGCGQPPMYPYHPPVYPMYPNPWPYPNYWPWTNQPSRITCGTSTTVPPVHS